MPVISFSLDTASINKAVRDLRRYVNSFESKVALVRQRVAERIRWSAETGFSSAMVEDIIHGVGPENDVTVELRNDDTVSVVIASGSQAVFIEFGAGVYYNGAAGSSPHPWGTQNGYLIGTYGLGKGARKVWGYYVGGVKSKESLTLTHGTPAAMPMYHGWQEAIQAFDSIVQEVFG